MAYGKGYLQYGARDFLHLPGISLPLPARSDSFGLRRTETNNLARQPAIFMALTSIHSIRQYNPPCYWNYFRPCHKPSYLVTSRPAYRSYPKPKPPKPPNPVNPKPHFPQTPSLFLSERIIVLAEKGRDLRDACGAFFSPLTIGRVSVGSLLYGSTESTRIHIYRF